jgi:hypothetical protein
MLITGITFSAINTFYYQKNLGDLSDSIEKVSGWYSQLAFVGYILISMASILSFFLYRKFFPGFITFCYLSLIGLVLIASWDDLEVIIKTPSYLYSNKGIGTFVNFGILFFAANTRYLPNILKIFYYLCFVFIIAGFINLAKVGIGAGRDQYLFAIREYSVYLIWVFPYFLLQDEPNKKLNILNLASYLFIFIFVLSIASRSYLIIFVIYFLVKFKNRLHGNNALMGIIGMAILISLGFFFLANSGMSKIVDGAFNILSERSSEDTRSSQLVEFIEQWDFNFLLEGVGPKKTWYWSSIKGQYNNLDNQFMLLAWWAGLPTLLVYVYYLLKTFFVKSDLLIFEKAQCIKLIIGLWILACMGFAIYVTISSDLYFYFISLLMGLYTCKYSKIYTDFEEDT